MPAQWEMVKEAARIIGRQTTYSEIIAKVRELHGEQNESSLRCAIISSTVNAPSRIYYQENKKPRICQPDGDRDFLYTTGRGQVVPYDPSIHGTWDIYKKDDGTLSIRQSTDDSEGQAEQSLVDVPEDKSLFALESHLRDYLAKNISKLNGMHSGLSVYSNKDGRDGIEFQTDVGPIDILAVDQAGDFVVMELKLGRGPDAALGQILRYMGWVEKHLAQGKSVKGVIIAGEISKKLRYAATQAPNVTLMEYQLNFAVQPVQI